VEARRRPRRRLTPTYFTPCFTPLEDTVNAPADDYAARVDAAFAQAWPTVEPFNPQTLRDQFLPAQLAPQPMAQQAYPQVYAQPILVMQAPMQQPTPAYYNHSHALARQTAAAARDPWIGRLIAAGIFIACAGFAVHQVCTGIASIGPWTMWAIAVGLTAIALCRVGGGRGVKVNVRIDNSNRNSNRGR
jgi:hypothetical protein